MANIPNNEAGVASSASDTVTGQVPLLAGDLPLTTGRQYLVAAAAISGAALPKYSVVCENSSGELILATYSATADAVKDAIGVTIGTVNQAATNRNCPAWTGGYFNIDALNWDSSFDTDAKKLAAFKRLAQNIQCAKVATA